MSRRKQEPFIEEPQTKIVRRYNPEYGDEELCECGHPYKTHFDSTGLHIACYHCDCEGFVEDTENSIGNQRKHWAEDVIRDVTKAIDKLEQLHREQGIVKSTVFFDMRPDIKAALNLNLLKKGEDDEGDNSDLEMLMEFAMKHLYKIEGADVSYSWENGICFIKVVLITADDEYTREILTE